MTRYGHDEDILTRSPCHAMLRVKCASKACPTEYWDRPEKALGKEATNKALGNEARRQDLRRL